MEPGHLIQLQLTEIHQLLELTIDDLDPAMLRFIHPGGTIGSIGAIYLHTVFSEDLMVSAGLREGVLVAKSWDGLVSEAPEGGSMTQAWSQRVEILDPPGLRRYARDVYAATDAFLSTLKAGDLDRTVDLTALDMKDRYTVGSALATAVVWHANHHCGEICALKGVAGLKGLPF